jgi:hypothetical protein
MPFRPWPLNSSAGKLHQDRRTLLSSVHGARKGSQRRLTTQLLRLENGCWWKRRSTISRTAIESLRMVTSRCLDEILWSSGTTKGPFSSSILEVCTRVTTCNGVAGALFHDCFFLADQIWTIFSEAMRTNCIQMIDHSCFIHPSNISTRPQ